jgi:hypothetical protein
MKGNNLNHGVDMNFLTKSTYVRKRISGIIKDEPMRREPENLVLEGKPGDSEEKTNNDNKFHHHSNSMISNFPINKKLTFGIGYMEPHEMNDYFNHEEINYNSRNQQFMNIVTPKNKKQNDGILISKYGPAFSPITSSRSIGELHSNINEIKELKKSISPGGTEIIINSSKILEKSRSMGNINEVNHSLYKNMSSSSLGVSNKANIIQQTQTLNRDGKISRSKEKIIPFETLATKLSDNYVGFLNKHKNSAILSGNKNYEGKTGNYFLTKISSGTQIIEEEEKLTETILNKKKNEILLEKNSSKNFEHLKPPIMKNLKNNNIAYNKIPKNEQRSQANSKNQSRSNSNNRSALTKNINKSQKSSAKTLNTSVTSEKPILKNDKSVINIVNKKNISKNPHFKNLENKIDLIKQNMDLTPIPVKKNKEHKVNVDEYQQAERAAVIIRRMEYSMNIKNLKNQLSESENIYLQLAFEAKVITIQRWWRDIFINSEVRNLSSIKIQKSFLGYIARKRYMYVIRQINVVYPFMVELLRIIENCHQKKLFRILYHKCAIKSQEKIKGWKINMITKTIRRFLQRKTMTFDQFFQRLLKKIIPLKKIFLKKLKINLIQIKKLIILQAQIRRFLYKVELMNDGKQGGSSLLFIYFKYYQKDLNAYQSEKNKFLQVCKKLKFIALRSKYQKFFDVIKVMMFKRCYITFFYDFKKRLISYRIVKLRIKMISRNFRDIVPIFKRSFIRQYFFKWKIEMKKLKNLCLRAINFMKLVLNLQIYSPFISQLKINYNYFDNVEKLESLLYIKETLSSRNLLKSFFNKLKILSKNKFKHLAFLEDKIKTQHNKLMINFIKKFKKLKEILIFRETRKQQILKHFIKLKLQHNNERLCYSFYHLTNKLIKLKVNILNSDNIQKENILQGINIISKLYKCRLLFSLRIIGNYNRYKIFHFAEIIKNQIKKYLMSHKRSLISKIIFSYISEKRKNKDIQIMLKLIFKNLLTRENKIIHQKFCFWNKNKTKDKNFVDLKKEENQNELPVIKATNLKNIFKHKEQKILIIQLINLRNWKIKVNFLKIIHFSNLISRSIHKWLQKHKIKKLQKLFCSVECIWKGKFMKKLLKFKLFHQMIRLIKIKSNKEVFQNQLRFIKWKQIVKDPTKQAFRTSKLSLILKKSNSKMENQQKFKQIYLKIQEINNNIRNGISYFILTKSYRVCNIIMAKFLIWKKMIIFSKINKKILQIQKMWKGFQYRKNIQKINSPKNTQLENSYLFNKDIFMKFCSFFINFLTKIIQKHSGKYLFNLVKFRKEFFTIKVIPKMKALIFFKTHSTNYKIFKQVNTIITFRDKRTKIILLLKKKYWTKYNKFIKLSRLNDKATFVQKYFKFRKTYLDNIEIFKRKNQIRHLVKKFYTNYLSEALCLMKAVNLMYLIKKKRAFKKIQKFSLAKKYLFFFKLLNIYKVFYMNFIKKNIKHHSDLVFIQVFWRYRLKIISLRKKKEILKEYYLYKEQDRKEILHSKFSKWIKTTFLIKISKAITIITKFIYCVVLKQRIRNLVKNYTSFLFTRTICQVLNEIYHKLDKNKF